MIGIDAHQSAFLKMNDSQIPVFLIAKSLQDTGSELTADFAPQGHGLDCQTAREFQEARNKEPAR